MNCRRHRSGQTLIFLIMVVVLLTFVVLWNLDVHKIIHVKTVTQNAGDASALMAARWQGITLNLVGELNLMNALALATGDAATSAAITNIQARLCYVGPMVAFMASQQAAKHNGIHVHAGFTQRLRAHAQRVRHDYPHAVADDGGMLFPEPWPGAWADYADMLDAVADHGVAAAPDNAALYVDYTSGHPLLDPAFYEAIAGRDWCWFHFNYLDESTSSPVPTTLLEAYRNFHPCWWPALPLLPRRQFHNSEIYGLGLRKVITSLENAREEMTAGGMTGLDPLAAPLDAGTNTAWTLYDPAAWTAWDAIDVRRPGRFPVVGPVRPPHDVTGADAVTRIEAEVVRLTPGEGGSEIRNRITWTAAAKPFGFLNEEDRPDAYDLVLPAFRQVRLVPVAASSAPSGGAYNLTWRDHIENHLNAYMAQGPSALEDDCWYCRQLGAGNPGWENVAFRQAGLDWLALPENVQTCMPGGNGPGPGGGTRIAH